jgi:hypothetical protein
MLSVGCAGEAAGKKRKQTHPPNPKELAAGPSSGKSGSRRSSAASDCGASSAGGTPNKRAATGAEVFSLDAADAAKAATMSLDELVQKIWRESYSPGREIRGAPPLALA